MICHRRFNPLFAFPTALLFLASASCTTPAQTGQSPGSTETVSTATVACNTLQCNISDSSWRHIEERHCGRCEVGIKSAFLPEYCTQEAAVALCQAILDSPGCTAKIQLDFRIAALADLGSQTGNVRALGCPATNYAKVIFEPDRRSVVTQFPEEHGRL